MLLAAGCTGCTRVTKLRQSRWEREAPDLSRRAAVIVSARGRMGSQGGV